MKNPTPATILVFFAAVGIAGFGVGDRLLSGGGHHRLSALPPTSTGPATGCRFSDGTRGPCDRLSPFCEAVTKAPNCDIDGQPRIDRNPSQGCATNTIPDAGADEVYAPGCEPLVGGTVTTPVTSTTTPVSTTTPDQDPVQIDYDAYQAVLVRGTLFQKWKASNPGEFAKYDAFRIAEESRSHAIPPVLASFTGQALVLAIEIYANGRKP